MAKPRKDGQPKEEPEVMPEVMPGLTVKQQRFIEEYCTDFNATQAAIRAGYSEKTAYSMGWQNLRKLEISEAIKMRLSELAMSAEEITRRLAQWGRGTLAPFMRVNDYGVSVDLATEQASANVHLIKKLKVTETIRTYEGETTKEVKTEIETHDAKDAVVQLAKMQGLFIEKHEHTGKDGGPIHVTVTVVKPRES